MRVSVRALICVCACACVCLRVRARTAYAVQTRVIKVQQTGVVVWVTAAGGVHQSTTSALLTNPKPPTLP